MALDHEHFMDIALELSREAGAQGNRPLGALIVDGEGNILARGGNRVYSDCDPTAHGEMVVIREVCAAQKRVELSDCTLYTALEPCPMCCWAILEAQVGCLVIGGRHAGIGRKDVGRYSVETLLELTDRTLDFVTGVRTQECQELRLKWIAERAARGLGPR
ncbi:MAG: nucleoside deaminase [Burkholderiales bacterium]|jgi:tRNA(adenine34) deaminase|nr:nucleoside deaminase [Burkholderiales bacterium]